MSGPRSETVQREMERLLAAAFSPARLAVINDSASHHGHSGDDGSGESHFTVEIEAEAFAGKSRLERQRLINRALGDIPGKRVHALAVKASAPFEAPRTSPSTPQGERSVENAVRVEEAPKTKSEGPSRSTGSEPRE